MAPYIAPADFRTATLKWFTRGLELTAAEAPDADLTDAIGRAERLIEFHTGDRFDALVGTVLRLRGTGRRFLPLPHRVRAVTAVSLVDEAGTATAAGSTYWRVHSSIVTGAGLVVGPDLLELKQDLPAGNASGSWPKPPWTIEVTGDFGWAAVPEAIKRATALIVWDLLKGRSPDLLRAERWQTGDATYEAARTRPTGIVEVDQIIEEYARFPVAVA